jgi:hypothetical protein
MPVAREVPMQLIVNSEGSVRGIYGEAIDLSMLGPLAMRRASHVEPDANGRWWAELSPVGGPKLGPFARRSDALSAEVEWLERHWLAGGNGDQVSATYTINWEESIVGLTIHYTLRTSLTDAKDVRDLVGELRRGARSLPFQKVGAVKEFRGPEADFEQSARDDSARWLKIQAAQYLEVGDRHFSVKPTHIIAFSVQPGAGCEPANFGFCRFPTNVEVTDKTGRVRQVPTRLDGWSWSSFCKTQYASDPRCGGAENFVRCHVGLCRLLELMRSTELVTVDVRDESHYWEHRDLKQLVNTVGEWNQFIAAFAGVLKDQGEQNGVAVESVIAGFPNFERLEAKGLDHLREKFVSVRRRKGRP